MTLELPPELCESLLDFMYTGIAVWENVEDATVMLSFSEQFQIRSLREECLKFLHANISRLDCVLNIWETAKLMELKELEEKASTVISKEFALVSSTEEFLAICRADFVVELLKKKDLNALEETVIKAGLAWIEEDFKDREQYCTEICQALRTTSSKLRNMAKNFKNLASSFVFEDAVLKYGDRDSTGTSRLNLEECLIIMGGYDVGSNRNVICFGFRQKKWFTLPPIPDDPKMYFSVCTSGCKMYVSGGFGNGRGFSVYDGEKNTWESLCTLLSPRQKHSMGYCNGKIVILGGTDPKENSKFVPYIDIYDIATNKWSETRTTLQKDVCSSTFCALGSKIFLFGGLCSGRKKAEKLQYFDIDQGYSVEDQWCKIPESIQMQARAVVVENAIHVISCKGEVFVLKYHRNTYSFENKGTVKYFPRKGFGVCSIDEKILIVGGEKDYSKTKDMIQYKVAEDFTFKMEDTMPLSMSHFCVGHMSIDRSHLSHECHNQIQQI